MCEAAFRSPPGGAQGEGTEAPWKTPGERKQPTNLFIESNSKVYI